MTKTPIRRSSSRYRVDWSDKAFPKIVEAEEGDEGGTSFAGARLEIIAHFTEIRDHAVRQIANARSLRASSVRKREEASEHASFER